MNLKNHNLMFLFYQFIFYQNAICTFDYYVLPTIRVCVCVCVPINCGNNEHMHYCNQNPRRV